ncbi:DUF930 domain-containing protein [Hoeflea sp. TYP-13]
MLRTVKRFSQKITPGAVASAIMHAIILTLLIFGLPQARMEAEGPEAIQIQLVHPEEDALGEEQQNAEPATEPTSGMEETASVDQAEVQALPALRPVYQFGEKNAGPSETADGDALSGSPTTETPPSEEPLQEAATPEHTVDVREAPSLEATAVPEAGDEPQKPAETTETVRSLHDDKSPVATTAMADLPRGIRAGDLCATELRRQLLDSPQAYWPDILPAYRLDEGTVLQVQKGAFRSNTRWFNLKFRCEVDEAATRVVSFEYDVGAPIPPAEWAGRGLPAS